MLRHLLLHNGLLPLLLWQQQGCFSLLIFRLGNGLFRYSCSVLLNDSSVCIALRFRLYEPCTGGLLQPATFLSVKRKRRVLSRAKADLLQHHHPPLISSTISPDTSGLILLFFRLYFAVCRNSLNNCPFLGTSTATSLTEPAKPTGFFPITAKTINRTATGASIFSILLFFMILHSSDV